ncbi:ATP synthase F0 subunit 8 (mitochondrion) [Littorina saxatilis]|uniref:ATP synthase complex subunit 8 n=3 Tax=Littorina TaxID=31213 RepID=Q9ZZU6_9CAEN|nr:ATP synthase F0 subunit 8 [Littorina saxatilis]ANJ78380.1 ATP synthase F0 subunit 8 [Littorina fabalis]ANJ78393.1 ATP synthase F0 subunit 8 [Littorina obtusata]ANJ78406.1 ATP synthase F0 subunit 8 [Littorina saxatilis]CAA10595.1 ATPase subunit 8 [Littorina saxatilis]
MPQLSPLNWIFLFIIFWAAVLSMSILIWWSSKIYFSSKTSEVAPTKENKWNW